MTSQTIIDEKTDSLIDSWAFSTGSYHAEVADVPEVRALLDAAKLILGYDMAEICMFGPEEKLQEISIVHPALYIANLAAVEVLRNQRPEAVSGIDR